MYQLLTKLIHYPDRLDALSTLLGLALSPTRGLSLLKSAKMSLRLDGRLTIAPCGRLYAGALSNRLQLDTAARGTLNVYPTGHLTIDGHVRISRTCKIYINGHLSIAHGTYIQSNTIILANSTVTVGANCAISWNCQLLDDDLHDSPLKTDSGRPKPITVGANVWIGANVIILKGVSIGANSTIGAGSIVTKSFPPNSFIGGNPARPIAVVESPKSPPGV